MVIILNGVGRSGKGTVYGFMNEIIPGIQYSWIDFARSMMRESGIPVDKKTPEIRKCLADVGIALEGLDIPYRDCINIISNVSRGCINDIHNVYLVQFYSKNHLIFGKLHNYQLNYLNLAYQIILCLNLLHLYLYLCC